MGQSTSQKRPWFAALLAVLVTGLGHLYLRRWRRALGWLALLFSVTALFVDPAALEALANGNTADPVAIAPVLIVGGFSVIDAYLLAYAQNEVTRLADSAEGELTHCPNCGKELDADLDFCQWCTTAVDALEDSRSDRVDERDD